MLETQTGKSLVLKYKQLQASEYRFSMVSIIVVEFWYTYLYAQIRTFSTEKSEQIGAAYTKDLYGLFVLCFDLHLLRAAHRHMKLYTVLIDIFQALQFLSMFCVWHISNSCQLCQHNMEKSNYGQGAKGCRYSLLISLALLDTQYTIRTYVCFQIYNALAV